MIKREPLLPPEHIYPIDDWRMLQARFAPHFVAQDETIFALSNGYLGMRGNFEEATPVVQSGTFVNGFFESWPIVYGEEAHGFAKTGQTMLNVTDSKIIRLYVDDEPLYLPTANLLRFERALDMRTGTLDRELLWETPSGKQVSIKSRRLVSFEHRHVAAISYELTVLNAAAPVVISSEIEGNPGNQSSDGDPRRGRSFEAKVMIPHAGRVEGSRIVLTHRTRTSKMSLSCGIDHTLEADCPQTFKSECSEDSGKVVWSIDAKPGVPVRLNKYMVYHTSRSAPPEDLSERTERTLDRVMSHEFDDLVAAQRAYMDDFWRRSDVEIRGAHPRIQQVIRFNLFHLIQAAARAEGAGIGARGLTGQAYEGHYFWDAEMYVLPFLIHTSPRIARNLLRFRHTHLDQARKRAEEVSQRGALFPWRTINGEEASAYYAAGTAQYHINADIIYTLRKYVDVTGDEEFLSDFGSEMLVETARLWADLGFYSDRSDAKFCIHGVTGPDEYNTVVNNNTFTNLMARENLWYAATAVDRLRREKPDQFAVLVHRTKLNVSEIDEWRRAADKMFVPFDEKLGIHPQDDAFLEREPWDFENTPTEKYPLLLHYHPLVIYRFRVIKQADIVLAMFLLGNEFSLEQKKRNFDYYDPLTTGDSSLSACIQSILAFEIGYNEKGAEYFANAALMDLGDIGGNVKDGCHIASMGGTWMNITYGIAGMRDYDGRLSFNPEPRGRLEKLRFPLTVRGQRLEVDIEGATVTYLLREGTGLVIEHRGEEVRLSPGTPVSFPLS